MSETTLTEQSSDLTSRIRKALRALASGGRPDYEEPEASGRYEGVWWCLTMALNDSEAMHRAWKAEDAREANRA